MGVIREFLADKTRVTAADSANGSNEDDTKVCLGFLVYLFAEYTALYGVRCIRVQ